MFASLKSRKTIFYAAIAIGLLTVTFMLSNHMERVRVRKEIQQTLSRDISNAMTRMEATILDWKQNLDFLSGVPPIQGLARAHLGDGFDHEANSSELLWKDRLSTIFFHFAQSKPTLLQLRYIGVPNQGRELVRVNQKDGICSIVPETELQEKAQRDYFQAAAQKKENEFYISNINYNVEQDGIGQNPTPTLRIAKTIFGPNGKFFGTVIVNLNMNSIFAQLRGDIQQDFRLYLTNSEGDFLLHPDPGKEFGFETGTPHRWDENFKLGKEGTVVSLENPVLGQFKRLYFDRQDQSRFLGFTLVYPEQAINRRINATRIGRTLFIFEVLVILLVPIYLLVRTMRQSAIISLGQARLAAQAEGSRDAIIVMEPNGTVLDWNSSAENMLEQNKTQALGQSIFDLVDTPESQDIMRKEMQLLMEEGGRRDVAFTLGTRTGNKVIVDASYVPIKDGNNHIVAIACSMQDITEKRELNARLLRWNESLEDQVRERTVQIHEYASLQTAILTSASNAMLICDKQGNIHTLNPAAVAMLKFKEQDLIGKTPDILHVQKELMERFPDWQNAEVPLYEKMVHRARMRDHEDEWMLKRSDGSQFPAGISVGHIVDHQQQVKGYLAIIHDISHQVEIRKKLLLAQEQLLKAAEVAQLGIWQWDLVSDRVLWNKQMYTIYNLDPNDDTPISNARWLALVHPEDRHHIQTSLEQAIRKQGPFDLGFRLMLDDKSIRHIRAAGVLDHDVSGRPTHMLGINLDITHQKEYEFQLMQASRAKSEFVANMSHEIRTPMNAIIGILQLMRDTPLNDLQADYLEKTESGAKSLLAILNDILDFSKIEAGKMDLDPNPCQLDQLLKEIGIIISPNMGKKEVELLFDLSPEVPQTIIADSLRLQQILVNLANNAVKFTDKGEIVVFIHALETTEDRTLLNIGVKDTGIGISPQHQKVIFEGFKQAEASTARRFGGTGLGLSISNNLVKMMGGKLEVESKLNEGSQFSFSIWCPVLQSESMDFAEAGPEFTNMSTLIIDSNPKALMINQKTARAFGWQVQTADSGKAALGLLEENPTVDVIFLAWKLSDLNGTELCKEIKKKYTGKKVPLVVMVSAYGREMFAQATKDETLCYDCFIQKPYTPSSLFKAVVNAKSKKKNPRPKKGPKKKRLQGLRILLVEDNVTNQMVAKRLLRQEGAEVTIANNGKFGVEALALGNPGFDLVLMDIQMPEMDGYTATRLIREQGIGDLPIIAMTANTMPADRQAALDSGMNDHIGKPFMLDEVVQTICRRTGRNLGTTKE